MKILSIRLKNLASIEGYFDIDFTTEPLASAGIFAISGPTGAGKSTILDALCLALYDKTPRFTASNESLYLQDVGDSQINQSDVKNVLRRGAGEGFAEVVFLGVDGHRYQSRWTVRRARGKSTGSLQAQAMQVVDLETDKELQGTKTEILNQLVILVGLTYEQFTRTVLLAQNDFATFLKSRESAKAELLEKLTGTEIYSQISRTVFARSKQAMEEYNQLKNSINLIELLPEEEVEQLQKDKLQQSEERAVAVKLLASLNEKLKVITSLKAQQQLLENKRKEEFTAAGQLKNSQSEHAERAEKLAVFKQQCEALQPELRKARELDTLIQGVRANYVQAEQRFQASQKKKEEAIRLLESQEKTLSKELQKLNVSHTDTFASLSHEAKLEQATLLLSEHEHKLTIAQKANDERVVQLNAFGIRSLGEEQGRLLEEQKRLQAARQFTADWIKQCKEVERIAQELAERSKSKDQTEKELIVLKEQLKAKNEQVQSLQRLYDNARVAMSQDVEAIRHNLNPGEACPVCGATEHPYTLGETVVDSIYHNIEKEYKAVADDYQQLNNRSIAAEQNSRLLIEQCTLLSIQLETLQKDIKQKTPERPEERTVAYFDLQLEHLQQQLNELAGKLKSYQQLYEEWQWHDNEIKKLRRQTDALREAISSCRLILQQVASGKEQVASAETNTAEEQSRFAKVRDELECLRKERSALLKGKTADDAESAIQRHEKELNELLEVARRQLDQQTARISGLQGEIKQLASVVDDLIREQQQIESPEKLPEMIAARQEANQEIERKLSLLEARLLQQEQNRIKLKDIEKELKSKQATAGQWEKLNKLVGSADGTKFKIIAQSYTLNLLLMHANKHLSYLSKRYKLQQVPDTLALQVIDCDMCNEIRTVNSLSGGESFLVSLALALGLSSLSSNNLRVESLFIDEGFGSLDAESLRTAMEALEQLQIQGRKIGVISHVQEMSERISVQIQVNKAVNGRSSIDVVAV
ncbi:AAA family ATPase [Bacteroides sp. 51]|uniref:AAA family ATPase n=1 Tax=Bacteroides sp. 51 TaxID=2302938 RepID=UPI0013D660A7|nr:AAA family ATPase [Bacteroides sp. 51]NDV81400.1 ATP-dependent endonuclease [Bacteroides sp. 51]